MRTTRLALLAMTSCLLLITVSYPAHGAATLTESGQQIQAPKSDIREVISDNAALVAEVEAVRQALAAERKSTNELVDELNAYVAASGEERRLLREQNEILKDMSDAYKRQAQAERERGFGRLLLGLVIGVAAGAAAN